MYVLFIVLLVFLLVFLIVYFKHLFNIRYLLYNFERCNCIVFGPKGTGKDLLFSYVIRRRKKPYVSNVNYCYKKIKSKTLPLTSISLAPNTIESTCSNNISKVKLSIKEGVDYYISDAGVYLPSYLDSKLYRLYPSMPLYYALSRHLTNSNIHANCQSLTRVWKALREQADFYVRTKKTTKFGPVLITKIITYDKYESAEANLLPLKTRFFNKTSKAQSDLFFSQHGDIRSFHIFQFTWSNKYDSRFYKKVFTGRRA